MTPASKPKLSVVTCSYNQGRYIADAIESVLAQQYPDVEHIVVDGGSSDETESVCRRYDHLSYQVAVGTTQAEALNIGFKQARGEIICWLNSDDYYLPGTFARVSRCVGPERRRSIVTGAAQAVDENAKLMWVLRNGRVPFRRLLFHPRLYPHNGWTVMPCQPSVFFHRRVLDTIGLLQTDLRYALDYEYWLRALRHGFRFRYIPRALAAYRHHHASITSQGYDAFLDEWTSVSDGYYQQLSGPHRAALESWWAYARVECVFVRRHKVAMQHMAERFTPGPAHHPFGRKAMVVARAATVAPWAPLGLAWQAVYHRCSRVYQPPAPSASD